MVSNPGPDSATASVVAHADVRIAVSIDHRFKGTDAPQLVDLGSEMPREVRQVSETESMAQTTTSLSSDTMAATTTTAVVIQIANQLVLPAAAAIGLPLIDHPVVQAASIRARVQPVPSDSRRSWNEDVLRYSIRRTRDRHHLPASRAARSMGLPRGLSVTM